LLQRLQSPGGFSVQNEYVLQHVVYKNDTVHMKFASFFLPHFVPPITGTDLASISSYRIVTIGNIALHLSEPISR
jgi:hypothetical protein